ncbi:arginosuccinate synthase [Leptospira fluminis]|uniref:Arginosuccinate synthase n=1 Tax=Leptospira fluminis TaxID=2484979 RepID=A0A4R9GSS3_9LEPT|nr:ATP-binding protein [Leptospira fluminis]TGK21073.1 arginosuccinate synthase [Leptospira fluminis]
MSEKIVREEDVFSEAWSNLRNYQELIRRKTAVIAYSGGKDSSLLLQFYLWLRKEKHLSKDPILFHLNHSIRKNEDQEKEILEYMRGLGLSLVGKKKTFRSFRIKPALA